MPQHLRAHLCDRFWKRGIPCPFHLPGQEDDPDKEDRKAVRERELALPDWMDNFWKTLAISASAVELMQQLRRMRTIQREGYAPNLPQLPPLQFPKPVPGAIPQKERPAASTLTGVTPRLGFAAISSLMIIELLRRGRSMNLGSFANRVKIAETRSASQLSGLTRGFSPGAGQALGPGRGGFQINAAARLKSQLGLGGGRKKETGGRRWRDEQGDHGEMDWFLFTET